jgi:transcriptional regulator with XRE-family HTH domain
MPMAYDPSINRRKLRSALRTARRSAKLTQREAAEALKWSLSKIIRIEAGTQGISVTDLRALLQLYNVTDDDAVKSLTDAALGSRGQSWWTPFREVISPQLAQYLGHEGSAISIKTFHPFLVPGLLHTEEYATGLLRVHLGPELTRRVVDLRMERQERIFEQDMPPELIFLIGEEALHRWIGGPAVMGRQLRRLLEVTDQPAVSLQIVPFSAGAHPGLLGPFILLGFEDPGEDLLFLEGATGDLATRDDHELITRYAEHFEVIRDLALPYDEARTVIGRQAARLEQADGGNAAEAGKRGAART